MQVANTFISPSSTSDLLGNFFSRSFSLLSVEIVYKNLLKFTTARELTSYIFDIAVKAPFILRSSQHIKSVLLVCFFSSFLFRYDVSQNNGRRREKENAEKQSEIITFLTFFFLDLVSVFFACLPTKQFSFCYSKSARLSALWCKCCVMLVFSLLFHSLNEK